MSEKPTYEELEQRVLELEQALSERNKIEETSKNVSELLSFFIKHSPIYTFLKKVSHDESKVLYASDNYMDMIGIPASEMVGKTMFELFPKEFAEKITRDDSAVINNENNLILEEELNDRNYVTYKFPIKQGGDTYLAGYSIDITEWKQNEEALKNSKAILDATGRMARVGGWVLDVATLEVTWTDETYRIHEVPLGQRVPLQEAIRFYHPEDRPQLEQAIKRTFDHGEPWDLELRFFTATGKLLWTRTICRPEIIDGKTVRLIGAFQDITQSKRAETALKNSERKWHDILVNTPQIGISLNPNAKIVFTNRYFLKLTGWEEQEVMGQDWFDMFIAENIREDVRGVFSTAMSQKDTNGISTYENEIMTKDGTRRNVAWSNVLTKNAQGEIVDVTCLGIDLTERRRAEEELKESEENYRLLVENQTDLVVKVDMDGRFLFASPSYCRMFGKTETELFGKTFMPLVHTEDREATERAMEALFSPPHTAYIEQRAMTRDGWRWFAWADTAVLDKAGRVQSIIGVGRDITDKKSAEEEQAILENQLRQAQKMESIGNLAGGIAHEFNNMLAIIMGNNELIMEELPQESLARQSTEEIRIAGLRARDVVKQLLTFSRQDDAVKKVMDLNFVVQESMKLIRSSTPINILIEQNLSADTYPVVGNDTQMNQILINLCNNAVDALPEMGGIITIELSNETIDIGQAEHQTKLNPGQYVKLVVSDNGAGMDTKTLGRVFEPYFTTKNIGEGTGIGMAVVHGIVERHGGDILIDSRPGQGTTCTILLPAHEGLIEWETDERKSLPGGDEHILYVDDEPSIARLGKRLLESLGYSAESTTDPEEALAMVRNDPNKFDLLITDIAMPNMTGNHLIVETLKIRQDMPTIICTGYSTRISENEAANIGVRSYITKPINKSELAKLVRNVLDGAKKSYSE